MGWFENKSGLYSISREVELSVLTEPVQLRIISKQIENGLKYTGTNTYTKECISQYGEQDGNEQQKIENSKSQVTIHGTIQIQLTLFKFVALFKISGTIEIPNMNSARALTREWLRHPSSTLFDESELCGWWIRVRDYYAGD
jgi:hypothetical protein